MSDLNLDRLCRLCLKDNFTLQDMYLDRSLSGEPIYKMINYVYDLEICLEDCLPSKICSPCIWRMTEFSDYKRNVHMAKAELMNKIGSPKYEFEPSSSATNEGIEFQEEQILKEFEPSSSATNEGIEFQEEQILKENEANQLMQEDEEIPPDIKDIPVKSEIESEEWIIPDKLGQPENPEEDEEPASESGASLPIDVSVARTSEPENSKIFVCDICRRSYLGKSALRHHVKSHYGDKQFKCGQCGQLFKTVGTHRNHVLLHKKKMENSRRDKEKAFVCYTCGKCYNNRQSLFQHSITHTARFSCSVCGKCFSSKGPLENHRRIHSNEKPFACVYCQKTFTQNSGLRRHMQLHSEVEMFQCTICERRFKTRDSLTHHELLHLQ